METACQSVRCRQTGHAFLPWCDTTALAAVSRLAFEVIGKAMECNALMVEVESCFCTVSFWCFSTCLPGPSNGVPPDNEPDSRLFRGMIDVNPAPVTAVTSNNYGDRAPNLPYHNVQDTSCFQVDGLRRHLPTALNLSVAFPRVLDLRL